MGQWNHTEGLGTGQAVAAVRAVTALSSLRVVLSLDQLAAYVGVPMRTLDVALGAGPVSCGQIERVMQGEHVGFRHPDAAWTTLPSRVAAASAGVEFARWFADWLDGIGPERRTAAHATARAVAVAARAAGRTALADRIESVYSRRKRREAMTAAALVAAAPGAESEAAESGTGEPKPRQTAAAKAVSRLPARATAGILVGTAVLVTGAVIGVAVLSETGAVASGVQSGSLSAAAPERLGANGIQPLLSSSSAAAAQNSVPGGSSRASSGSAAAGGSAALPSSSASGITSSGGVTSPVVAAYVAGVGSSGKSSGSSDSGSGGSSAAAASSSPATAASTAASAATSSAAPATSAPATTSVAAPTTVATTPSSSSSGGSCLNVLGLISICL